MSDASDQHPLGAEEAQRRLDLLMRIDEIRDAAVEPGSMLGVLLGVVAAEVRAELALLFVLEPGSGVLEPVFCSAWSAASTSPDFWAASRRRLASATILGVTVQWSWLPRRMELRPAW